MTPEELEQKDGREGRPAHLAFQGKIYDVGDSKLWPDGNHMKLHQAGRDLTSHLPMAPHGPEVFERPHIKEIGVMEQGSAEDLDAEYDPKVKFRELYQRFHPHPIAIHFPIGVFIFGAFLHIVFLVTGAVSFESASFYSFVFASLATPMAVASGFLSWWLNYDMSLTYIFRNKIAGSMVLMLIAVLVLTWRLVDPGVALRGDTGSLAYAGLVVIAWPVVAFIGYMGGKIIFPS